MDAVFARRQKHQQEKRLAVQTPNINQSQNNKQQNITSFVAKSKPLSSQTPTQILENKRITPIVASKVPSNNYSSKPLTAANVAKISGNRKPSPKIEDDEASNSDSFDEEDDNRSIVSNISTTSSIRSSQRKVPEVFDQETEEEQNINKFFDDLELSEQSEESSDDLFEKKRVQKVPEKQLPKHEPVEQVVETPSSKKSIKSSRKEETNKTIQDAHNNISFNVDSEPVESVVKKGRGRPIRAKLQEKLQEKETQPEPTPVKNQIDHLSAVEADTIEEDSINPDSNNERILPRQTMKRLIKKVEIQYMAEDILETAEEVMFELITNVVTNPANNGVITGSFMHKLIATEFKNGEDDLSEDPLLTPNCFQRFITPILQANHCTIKRDAVLLLHLYAESYLMKMVKAADMVASASKRSRVCGVDLTVAFHIHTM